MKEPTYYYFRFRVALFCIAFMSVIAIADYFGTKKVIEINPYFDKQQLTKSEFLIAIELLEKEKNKATDPFL